MATLQREVNFGRLSKVRIPDPLLHVVSACREKNGNIVVWHTWIVSQCPDSVSIAG